MIKTLILILMFLPSGFLVARTITASGSSNSQVQSAIDSAANGDTVSFSGNATWGGTVTINGKAITLDGNGATVTHGNASSTLLNVTASSAGHVQIAGINFKPGSAGSGKTYMVVSGDAQIVIVHDCSWDLPNFALDRGIDWKATGGLIYNSKLYSSNTSSGGSGPGSGSGGLRHLSNKPWNDVGSWGNKSNGSDALFVEDCTLENMYNQGLDFDDNSRAVVRHCQITNFQVLTHGTTSKQGGRQLEYYDNVCKYTKVNNTWVNVNRYIWIRAGTLYVHDCSFDALDSGGYWGGWKPSFVFIAESLTRSGAGSGCQSSSDYPNGVHWPGTGTTGSSQKNGTDPVRIWANTGPGATKWGTNDQTGAEKTCSGGVTADVFRLNRDIYIDQPPSGYVAYPYPHPLRTGGGPTPSPTSTPQPTSTPSPSPSSTPQPTATPPQPTPSPSSTPSPPQPTPTPIVVTVTVPPEVTVVVDVRGPTPPVVHEGQGTEATPGN